MKHQLLLTRQIRTGMAIAGLASASAWAQNADRLLWIGAVGEMPNPKLTVVEQGGFKAYVPEELSKDALFPTSWTYTAGEQGESTFDLRLGQTPVQIAVPKDAVSITLTPSGESKPVSIAIPQGPALLLILKNPRPGPWPKAYGQKLVPLAKNQQGAPATTIVNLTGLPLAYPRADRKVGHIAPRKSVSARLAKTASGHLNLPVQAKSPQGNARMSLSGFTAPKEWQPVAIITTASLAKKAQKPRLRSLILNPPAAKTVDVLEQTQASN